ncbi:putative U4/U6.U5 tri-snRNP-associated protein 1 [Hypsibius exemplaris]|uniref:U4/U6.U5 tri-snRNP-associated protein 1 n=1 Tax=Hypsibius exemplaris TaxID=2072580 RepID=A0A1W0WTJ9_HYPEX|nr:putative U4/U6.U5 tri-snRNP-associated protein 1 [Hypsibius exemplaris]
MENFREPGEMSSGDERAEKKRKSHKKEKKDKKRDQDADGGEEQEEKRRHKKEHRHHKKSKKSKSEKRDKSPAVDDDESAERKSSRIKSTEHVPGDATLGAHNSPTTTDIAGKESSSSSVGKTAAATIAPFVEPMDLNSGQRVEEMSIEETNKVRAKLGLKPLQIDGAKNADGSLVTPKKQEDVHAPPINMADAKKAQLLKEKLETRKEKRQIQKKLSKVKPLAAGSDDEESAEAWAERTRREARLKAAERERLQAEQDAEEEKEEVRRQPSYTMNDLKGLRVEHDMEKFQEGRDVILTLKDSGVLDEDAGDVLVSTALNEEERLKKNIENRKKKAAYNPYENADNLDEFGTPVEPQLLKKYDETIGGEQKKAFVIGAGGSSSAAAAFRQQPMVNLKNLHDLMATPQTLAREYYTEDEMSAKFKKVRKIKKKGGETGGSQIRSRIIDDEDAAPSFPTSSNQILDEEDDTELQLALSRSRRIKQEESFKPVIKREEDDDVEMEPSQSPASKPSASSSRGVVYLDETSEFCRAVGSSASTSRAAVREEVIVQPEYEDDAVDMDVDMDRDDDGHLLMKQDAKGGWSEVQFEAEPANLGSDEEDGGGGRRGGRKQAMATTRIDSHGRRVLIKSVMDDEPTCERGVGAALNLIVKKGLLANENASRHPTVFNDGKPSSIPAQTYVIDDKVIDDDKRGRQDRYMGPTTTFKEKAGYQPTFVLAYHDTAGHAMNQKEAFRDLSHKFHGKGPGKMKTERRAKKYLEEKLMLEMSSTDTPLHTVQKMQQKQQELQTPYIVLSGAASAKGPTPISKKSNY